MVKKILVVGSGGDVVDYVRDDFINNYFDDVVIMNQAIFHIDQYKRHFGNPTIWGTCGWAGRNPIFDPTDEELASISDILRTNNIRKVWVSLNRPLSDMPWTIPTDTRYENLENIKLGLPRRSTGMTILTHAIEQYDEVQYMGMDGYRKSHHFYPNDERMPNNAYEVASTMLNYMAENRYLRQLEHDKKVSHIDKDS